MPDSEQQSRDWPLGNYLCRCVHCGNQYTGPKRSAYCRLCDSVHSAAPQNEQGSQSVGSTLSSAVPSGEGSGLIDALHRDIMNLPCPWVDGDSVLRAAFKAGHKEARHAAAELVSRCWDAHEGLVEACRAIVAWDEAEKNAKPYDEDGGAGFYQRIAMCNEAFAKARAAIAKARPSHCEPCQTGAEPSEQGPASPSPYIHRSNP